MRHTAVAPLLAVLLLHAAPFAAAQTPENGSAGPAPVAAAAVKAAKPAPKPAVPAKQLFGAVKTAAPLAARSIGFYARGCLAGARPLAIDGPAWQAMRLSRNRNWGHPELIAWLERFAKEAQAQDRWPGLLVGDLAQPRGGPMLSGHASHQVGLDADLWLTPMPDRRLTEQEREELSATSMLGPDNVSVDPSIWTETRAKLIKRAAAAAEVERIFVHPAIKKALCEAAPRLGADKTWLHKVRPYWGHHYHFHVRLSCPKDSPNCRAQDPIPGDDGCGSELAHWLKLISAPPKPPPDKPSPPPRPITLDGLPAECRVVLESGKAPVTKAGLPTVAPAPTATTAPGPNAAAKAVAKQ